MILFQFVRLDFPEIAFRINQSLPLKSKIECASVLKLWMELPENIPEHPYLRMGVRESHISKRSSFLILFIKTGMVYETGNCSIGKIVQVISSASLDFQNF